MPKVANLVGANVMFRTVPRPESVQWFNCASVALALRTDEAVLRFIRAHPLVGRESLEHYNDANQFSGATARA